MRRANNEPARPKLKARKLILPVDSWADTRRAAVARNFLASEEDVSAEILGRSINLPAPKARVPSEEARRPSGHKGRHAATAGMPARKRWLPSEQVPFDDSPSGLRLKRTKRKKRSKEEPSAKTSLAQKPLEQIVVGKSRDGETRGSTLR